MIFQTFVPGAPGAKGRPRFNRASGRAYTPANTLKYESYLKAMFAEAMEGRPPMDGPVRMELDFIMPEPKSMRKADQGRQLFHVKRPDMDNLEKAVLDAANGVVFVDDSQVCWVIKRKRYGSTPGVRVEAVSLLSEYLDNL